MTDEEYKALVKKMPQVHGVQSEHTKRRSMEQRYFAYWHANGVRLRDKYGPR